MDLHEPGCNVPLRASVSPEAFDDDPYYSHWADHAARRTVAANPDAETFVAAAGITPSGVVTVGNFREVITVDLVVRALRDRRWKYIRNFQPDRPYVLDVAFRDQMPMMREMRALAEAGELQGDAALWFRPQRDPEELYDTLEDPHEVRNLAGDPRHAVRLAEMRDALDEWLLASGDLGLVEESELARRFWPGGAPPATPTPQLHVGKRGRVAASHATPGASIEIRVADGPWRLYHQPVEVAPESLVEARATRYGWATSELQELRVP